MKVPKASVAFVYPLVVIDGLFPVSRQELINWLQYHIAEQKRIDLGTSGVSSLQRDASSPVLPISRENSTYKDLHLLLPGDAKKQRKQTKQIFKDRGGATSRGIMTMRRLMMFFLSYSSLQHMKMSNDSNLPCNPVRYPLLRLMRRRLSSRRCLRMTDGWRMTRHGERLRKASRPGTQVIPIKCGRRFYARKKMGYSLFYYFR